MRLSLGGSFFQFMTDRMLLQVYATQVATLQAQIASRESSIEAAEMAKERDSAIARVDELQSRSQKVWFWHSITVLSP